MLLWLSSILKALAVSVLTWKLVWGGDVLPGLRMFYETSMQYSVDAGISTGITTTAFG